jgi:hypothetical protein
MDARIGLSRLLRLVLLAAFVAQCVLVQTHVHVTRLPTFGELPAAQAADGPAARSPQQAGADYCALCWEAAMAGHYSPPPAVAIPPAPAPFSWIAAAVFAGFGLARPAHGWLSRAPPR